MTVCIVLNVPYELHVKKERQEERYEMVVKI